AGGEVGGAQESAAHLLENDGELHEAEALAAKLLGDDQALEAELVGHLAPDLLVVALLGVHEAAHFGLGRLALEELAGDAAELFLLLVEGEVHWSPRGRGRRLPAVVLHGGVPGHQRACVHTRTLRSWSRWAPGSCGPTSHPCCGRPQPG